MMPPAAAAMSSGMSNCAAKPSLERRAARGSGSRCCNIAAWTRAWQSTVPGPITSTPSAALVGEREIVSVLASMALACAAAAAA
jgi:hypothetical protein